MAPLRKVSRKLNKAIKDVVLRNKENKLQCLEVTQTLTTTWAELAFAVDPNAVAQGDDTSDRDGNKIYQKGIQFRWTVRPSSDRPQAMRVLVLEEKTPYTSTDLPTSFNGCITANSRAKFTVKRDYIINPIPHTDDSGTSLYRSLYSSYYVKLNKMLTFYNTSAGGISKGKIQVWLLSDNLAGGTDFIDVDCTSIFHFQEV